MHEKQLKKKDLMAMQLGRCYEAWMLSIAANGMPPKKKLRSFSPTGPLFGSKV